ncbi:MAG: translocation/assembly module TamB domain-containing protein, partial [Alistipes sp.]|nr:translocation/assembly module TamB domain-containing protein [Alistipes sp.]
ANIRLDSLSSNGFTAPSLRLTSGWDFGRKRAGAALTRLDRADTVLRGYYIPGERRYYARLTVDTLNMGLLGPILEGVVSDTKGRGDADVVLRGVGRAAELSGEVKVTDLSTKVDFTQVEYRIPEAVVEVKNNHFIARRVPVLDPENNRGLFGIDLDMEHLSNIRYKVTLDPRQMLVLNTTIEDNNLFYGRVFATGEGRITGSKGHVEMDITATTNDHSTFFMPLSEQSNIQTAEFVTFVKPNLIDSTDRVAERRRLYEERYRKKQGASSQMHINLDLNVRDNVEMEMMVAGSPIKARGEGSLSLEIVPQTNTFEMYGDYAITEGSYHFSLENLISKRFILEDGSLIQWTGDPMDARLNIDALYKLKTSIQPLLQGTADMAIDRSVPVECRIHIGERLSNPDISFSVVVPDTDPETQSIITTALSTPESVDMQFLYLLVFNNFMAENNSSTSNLGASASAATGLEFLANQLSRLLSADDYNLVIRYRPKSEVASDEVDFGLSKSILNDRLYVEVEGNYLIDSKQAINGSMSNFMGEAHVSYLIDRSGALRVKAFTQTIDRFDENQGLQETGVGISYKEDFNNFKDLVRRIKERFTSRKRRQRLAEQAAAAAQTEQTLQSEQPENHEK